MSSEDFAGRYGPWALVAGASGGLGITLSHEIAARGLNVAMLARTEQRLLDAAADVAGEHGVKVRTLVADLADPQLAQIVAGETADIEIGLLIYSAAMQFAAPFEQAPLDDHLRSIAVNCTGLVLLTDLLAPKMLERGRGGIGIMSSTAANQGSPNMASYAAAKAFGWILAESLWAEFAGRGVDVCTVVSCPIASAEFWEWQKMFDLERCQSPDSSDPLDRARARLMTPSEPIEVAGALLDGLGNGPTHYAHPTDEDVANVCFSGTRPDAIALKRAVYDIVRTD